jgi:hypothetical protein
MNKVMEDFKYIVQEYFFELGNELSELGSNIWKALTTKKWIMIVSGIILFILGCFIWRPLCLLTITGLFLLCATFCIMLIPITLAVATYILFHLSVLDGEVEKYPVLNETLSIICSIAVFVFTTYLAYDCAIRDLWYQPELWSEILKLK